MNKLKKENVKIMAALTGGIVLGGTLGVLFAPRKGSETREKIKLTFEVNYLGFTSFVSLFINLQLSLNLYIIGKKRS